MPHSCGTESPKLLVFSVDRKLLLGKPIAEELAASGIPTGNVHKEPGTIDMLKRIAQMVKKSQPAICSSERSEVTIVIDSSFVSVCIQLCSY